MIGQTVLSCSCCGSTWSLPNEGPRRGNTKCPLDLLKLSHEPPTRQASFHAWLGTWGIVFCSASYRKLPANERSRTRHAACIPVRQYRTESASMLTWRKFFLQDLANVEAGIYPIPADHDGSLLALIHRSRIFLDDLPSIHRRRKRRAYNEVLNETTRGKRPRYYLQNFHYQSGGWLTEKSAELYDTQVEIFFNGSANAIRRQALPQLHEVFAGRDQRKLKVIDVGCGTGRFIDALKQVWPKLPILGIDMSEAYVKRASRHLRRCSRVNLSVAKAESLPVANESQDALISIFLFHELPPKVRRVVLRECARVLKPGGRLVLVDSLQRGDPTRL